MAAPEATADAFPAVPTSIDVNEEDLYKIMGLLTAEGEPMKDTADEAMIKRVCVFSQPAATRACTPLDRDRFEFANHRCSALRGGVRLGGEAHLASLADVQETRSQVPSRQEP